MSLDYEFEQVDHVTVGALGSPGHRTFMLQVRQADEVVSLVIEKQHIVLLADVSRELFSRIGFPVPLPEEDEEAMALDETIEPSWRVGEMTLGYEEDGDKIVIGCAELVEEDESPSSARFWLTRSQLASLADHGLTIAARGRPACPLCGRPMDAEGHQCIAMNGHGG